MIEDNPGLVGDELVHPRREFLQQSLAAGMVATGMAGPPPPGRAAFARYQQRRRRELWGLLGDLPWNHRPGPPRRRRVEKGPGYTLEHLELDLNGFEKVPAILLIPDQRPEKAPGLLYIPWHGGT